MNGYRDYQKDTKVMERIPKVVQWIVAALAAVVLAGGTAWLSNVNAQVSDLQAKHEKVTNGMSDLRERMMKVETKVDGMTQKLDDAAQQQRSISEKLDHVIDNQHK